jgi:hypothetical protein
MYVVTAVVTPGVSDAVVQTCAPCAYRFMDPTALSVGAGGAAGYVASQSLGAGGDGTSSGADSTAGSDTGDQTDDGRVTPEDDDFWEDWTSCEG